MDLEGPEGGGGGRILISQPKISTKSIVPEEVGNLRVKPFELSPSS